MFTTIDSPLATPPIPLPSTAPTDSISSEDSTKFKLTNSLCKLYKVKQLSWSRCFAYPQFGRHSDGSTYLAHPAKIALSNAPLITQKLQ